MILNFGLSGKIKLEISSIMILTKIGRSSSTIRAAVVGKILLGQNIQLLVMHSSLRTAIFIKFGEHLVILLLGDSKISQLIKVKLGS